MISLNLGYPPVSAVLIDKRDRVVVELMIGYPLPRVIALPVYEPVRLQYDVPPTTVPAPRFGQREFLRVGRVGRVIQYLE